MKNILFIILLYSVSNQAQNKFQRFEAIQTCVILTTSTGEYVDSEPWDSQNILITLDPTKDEVSIYAQKPHVYNVLKALPAPDCLDSSAIWMKFQCINEKGEKCILRQVRYAGRNYPYTDILYVDYQYLTIAYRMKLKENP